MGKLKVGLSSGKSLSGRPMSWNVAHWEGLVAGRDWLYMAERWVCSRRSLGRGVVGAGRCEKWWEGGGCASSGKSTSGRPKLPNWV